MSAAPIVFGREFFEVDPRSTALIVIDMQNAFVAEGATYETPVERGVTVAWEGNLIVPKETRPRGGSQHTFVAIASSAGNVRAQRDMVLCVSAN